MFSNKTFLKINFACLILQDNVGENKSKEAQFIRALMTSVCSSAIIGKAGSFLSINGHASGLGEAILPLRLVYLCEYYT